jgi:hypothetical protein
MVTLRKVTLGALLAASLAVLALAAFLLGDYRQWEMKSQAAPQASLDTRSRALEDRVEFLTRRAGDVELLVVVLLGTSGLYAIVFVLSSFFSAMSFARQADRSIAAIRDQLGLAMGDLRELQEEARKLIHEKPQLAAETAASRAMPPSVEAQLKAIANRIAAWDGAALDAQRKLELSHYESAAAYLELTGGPQLGAPLASLYRRFAEIYGAADKARHRFYLTRALALAPSGSQFASEVHYDLACWFAGNRDFPHAIGELTFAFQHQSKVLDDQLARDIEEGGRLYELASTPPFDKALNDLLLNMSIGIG